MILETTRYGDTIVWECPGATREEIAATVDLWAEWGILCRAL